MSKVVLFAILLTSSLLSSFSQVLLKKAAIKKYDSIILQYVTFYVLLGYCLFFIVLLINIFVMRFVNMNIVSVFTETMPLVISVFMGHLFFNETINNKKIIATSLIIIGVILIII